MSNPVQTPPLPTDLSSPTVPAKDRNLMVSTWNCRGLQNATPYLNQLIQDGSDIIAINEHWLWPYQLPSLHNIHPDFDGYGVSDNRLDEHSELVRGCGGVGFIWRKSLQVSPLTNICSDRICAIRVSLSQSSGPSEKTSVHIICAYLPSSDHSIDEFNKYVIDLVSVISSLESYGPLIIVGDLYAHLNAPTNQQSNILLESFSDCNLELFIASSSCIAKGPGYTFFSGDRKTTVDYILVSTSISHSIVECYTHDHHDLNFSDHLPLSDVES